MNQTTLPTRELERAYITRDPAYTGIFFTAVKTTGVFCRPNCPARTPLPRNVEYFPTARAAMAAGYRPCKRCRPLALDDQPEWVATLMQEIEADPSARLTDRTLRERGIDPATARRYFKRHYGLTFQGFARARRLAGALARIRE
ncbi:MAG TPA: Ada metal-binding domain-containing protein, partial [Verrucomicrobiae bacterium]|nr:Ada metal-binding domain-containing protein [Verrucomicrobiae bacterium]